jgi:hypothetical protein
MDIRAAFISSINDVLGACHPRRNFFVFNLETAMMALGRSWMSGVNEFTPAAWARANNNSL